MEEEIMEEDIVEIPAGFSEERPSNCIDQRQQLSLFAFLHAQQINPITQSMVIATEDMGTATEDMAIAMEGTATAMEGTATVMEGTAIATHPRGNPLLKRERKTERGCTKSGTTTRMRMRGQMRSKT